MDHRYGNQPGESEQQLGSRTIFWASCWSGLFLLGCSAVAVVLFGSPAWTHLTASLRAAPQELSVGAVCGGTAAALVVVLWRRAGLSEIRSDLPLVDALLEAPISLPLAIWISAWAGLAEELFFRGVLQPALGLWVTAVLFVALHGYVRWDGPKHLLFAGLMLGLSAGLGYLARGPGLLSAMAAHAAYDFVLLATLGGGGSRD